MGTYTCANKFSILSLPLKVFVRARTHTYTHVSCFHCQVFVDPFQELEDAEQKARDDKAAAAAKEAKALASEAEEKAAAAAAALPASERPSGVGRYLKLPAADEDAAPPKAQRDAPAASLPPAKKSKVAKPGGFGDFSGW